MPLSIGDL